MMACSTPESRRPKQRNFLSDFFQGKAFCPSFCEPPTTPESPLDYDYDDYGSPVPKKPTFTQEPSHDEGTIASTLSPASTVATISPLTIHRSLQPEAEDTFENAKEEIKKEINFDDAKEETAVIEEITNNAANPAEEEETNAPELIAKTSAASQTDTIEKSVDCSLTFTQKIEVEDTSILKDGRLSKSTEFYIANLCLFTLTVIPAALGLFRLLSHGTFEEDNQQQVVYAPRTVLAEF